MATSPHTGVEITWAGPPRSYTPGRPRQIQYVTLHYTAGAEGPTSAEAGAAYDRTRTDGTSCHYFTDSSGAALQEVRDQDQSHSALYHGNAIGIHVEICGTRQTRAQWLDPVSLATLETTAALVGHLCTVHGLPVRRLTAAQTRAAWYAAAGSRPKGINDHAAVTEAYPEDGGTHTDVGAGFPWDVFMPMVEQSMEGNLDAKETGIAVWETDGYIKRPAQMFGESAGEYVQGKSLVIRVFDRVEELAKVVDALSAKVDHGVPVILSADQMAELRAGIVADLQTLVFRASES